MPSYAYEALDKGGKPVRGAIEAESEETVLERLKGLGYYPTRITKSKAAVGKIDLGSIPGLRWLFGRVKLRHVSTFTRQLATLIEAGLPLLRSLAILHDQTESGTFKVIIKDMYSCIENGGTLSEGMSRYPKIFNKLYINMVRAGEIGGVMEAVLKRIAQFLENSRALRSKVKSALMYPVMVVVLCTAIVSFILIFVIPKFAAIYAEMGATLPAPTLLLINMSHMLTDPVQLSVLAVVLIALVVGYKYANRYSASKLYIDSVKLRLPIFGQLVNKIAIARFSSTLATLITSGVPILQALEIVRESSGNEVVAQAMKKVYESIREGETIHEPLSKFPVFPPLVVHMIAVGEETGALDQMLVKVAETYEAEVDDTVKGLTSLIEPLLIVMLGAIVGFIVVALYLPMFNIGNAIK